MKGNIKLIIVFGIIVVLLAAAVVFMSISDKKESNETDTETDSAVSEQTTKLLYDKNPADISKLTITNSTGSYEVTRFGEGDAAVWGVEELLSVPVNSSAINTFIEKAATMTVQQTVVEDAPDLSIYGLNNPAASVKVQFTDSANTVKELCIGNTTPASSTKTYFCFSGEKTVYTVNTSDVSCFLTDKYDCINKVVYTAFTPSNAEDTTDYTRINKMVISRKDLDYDIEIEYDKRLDDPDTMAGNSSYHIMTSPVKLDLNPDKSADVTGLVFGLTAASVEVINPTDEQMAEYGLSDPYADIFMDISGGDFHMIVGSQTPDKTGRYCYAQDIDIIYVFDNASLPWVTIMPLDITSTIITFNYVYSLKSLDVIGGDVSAHFTMSGTEDKDFAVQVNGNDIDKDLFKNFYQYILRAPAEELYLEDIITEQEPSLVITINAENNTDELRFISIENRRTVIVVNGKPSFTCKTSYVDRLFENLRLIENGEDIITSW